jgi:hypothetical protein
VSKGARRERLCVPPGADRLFQSTAAVEGDSLREGDRRGCGRGPLRQNRNFACEREEGGGGSGGSAVIAVAGEGCPGFRGHATGAGVGGGTDVADALSRRLVGPRLAQQVVHRLYCHLEGKGA